RPLPPRPPHHPALPPRRPPPPRQPSPVHPRAPPPLPLPPIPRLQTCRVVLGRPLDHQLPSPLRHPLLAAACCLHYAAWLGGIGISPVGRAPGAQPRRTAPQPARAAPASRGAQHGARPRHD